MFFLSLISFKPIPKHYPAIRLLAKNCPPGNFFTLGPLKYKGRGYIYLIFIIMPSPYFF